MNNRFIKKLWHTNRKIFLKEFSILQTINSDGNVEHTYFEYNHKTQNLERLSSCQIEEIYCTGLKDKNGKLIYEGDIVSIDDGELKGIAQRHDKFDEYYGCIEIKLICKYTTIYKPTVFAESEVIGNIYENEDLLKCENQ